MFSTDFGNSGLRSTFASHLDNFYVLFAPLHREARDAAELLRLCVMDGGPGAADELARVQGPRNRLHLQSFPQRAAVAGGVHHHGLNAGVYLRFHHGDL